MTVPAEPHRSVPEARVSPRSLFMVSALLVVAAFFACYGLLGGDELGFMTARNLSLLSTELASSGVLALGMLLVILPGHVDLSAGSAVGLTGGLAAMLVIDPAGVVRNLLGLPTGAVPGLSAPLAMLLTLLFSIGIYALMGMLVAYQRMPAFMVTLGGLLAFKGLHWKVIANATVPISHGGASNAYAALTTAYLPVTTSWIVASVCFAGALGISFARSEQTRAARERWLLTWVVAGQLLAIVLLGCGRYRGVPLAALLLGLVSLAVYVLTEKTTFGRYLYAIGGNEQAARLAGIAVERTIVTAFACMGAISALSGLLQTSYAGSSTTTIGQLMELDAVAACVIGGASLKGGRGSAFGVLFGALIMAVLLNGMTLMAVAPENKLIARGLILGFAVWIDLRLSRRGR
ncbi:MAG: Monosaccharide-transporting ATPase [Myxococcaceae bacterium]|nr:Monosaccharide-transporting ATPase [Myxococcaceae bacterium]